MSHQENLRLIEQITAQRPVFGSMLSKLYESSLVELSAEESGILEAAQESKTNTLFKDAYAKELEAHKGLAKQSVYEHLSLENLYRISGVTVFPISDPRYLGIRFDTYNETKAQFQETHYVILKKSDKNGVLQIFKHTIPNFIKVEQEFAEAYNLYCFVKQLRNKLTLWSQKVQVLNSVAQIQDVDILDNDIGCTTTILQVFDTKLKLNMNYTSAVFVSVLNKKDPGIEGLTCGVSELENKVHWVKEKLAGGA